MFGQCKHIFRGQELVQQVGSSTFIVDLLQVIQDLPKLSSLPHVFRELLLGGFLGGSYRRSVWFMGN